MHSAKLITESKDAKSVASALQIDNIDEKKLKITCKTKGNMIITSIHAKTIPTLLGTLDDIVSCQMSAEKVI